MAAATKLQPVAAVPKPKPRPRPKPKLKMSAADRRAFSQIIAAVAAGFLPIASFVLAHTEVSANPWKWLLLVAALTFSAPTLVEWAEKWCRGKYKAWGFTILLEGVMVFSSNQWLALSGLLILVAINCNSAWTLAGKK